MVSIRFSTMTNKVRAAVLIVGLAAVFVQGRAVPKVSSEAVFAIQDSTSQQSSFSLDPQASTRSTLLQRPTMRPSPLLHRATSAPTTIGCRKKASVTSRNGLKRPNLPSLPTGCKEKLTNGPSSWVTKVEI